MDETTEPLETESRAKRIARKIVIVALGAVMLLKVLHILAPALNNPLQLRGRRAVIFWLLVATLAVITLYRLYRALRPVRQQQ